MSRIPQFHKTTGWIAVLMCQIMAFCCFGMTVVHAEERTTRIVKVGWYQSDCFQEGTSDEEEKSGYCYEYLQKAADYIDLQYEYVYGGWSELFAMLENGEIDFLAGVSMTEERKEKMLFPDQAMGTDVYCLYKQADNTAVVSGDISTINGKRIGGIYDNRMTLLAVEWAQANDLDAEVVYFNSFEEMDAAFENGEVDLITGTQNNVLQLDDISIVAKVGEEPYYLAVNKQREDLLSELNQALSTLQEMDPFLLQNLQYANYGATVANRTLSSGEEQWISSHDTLRVGYLENYAPFCSKSDSGEPTGIMTDVLEQLWAELGLSEKIKIEYHSYAGSDELEQELISGNVDVILPISRELWYLENKGIDSTSAVISCSENLVFNSRKDSDHIKSLAVNKNNTMQIVFSETNYPEAELVLCADIKACLDAVAGGDADGTIVNGYRTAMVTGNNSYKMLSYIPVSGETARCFGVREADSSLLLLLNRGLKIVGSDYGADIANKYVSELYSYTAEDFIKDNIIGISLIILIFVAVVFGILLRNVYSQKKHAAELKIANAEQEAQLEEITSLNEQLEESAAEQEAQIEEVTALNSEIEERQAQLEERMKIIQSMSRVYYASYYVDIPNDYFIELSDMQHLRAAVGTQGNARASLVLMCENLIEPEFKEEMYRFVDLDTLDERMGDKKAITFKYIGRTSGWSQAYMIEGDRDENGNLRHVFFATRSIHEEKALEEKQERIIQEARERAEAANKAKTSFLFNMSHDIRTPMNAIMGFRDLLEKHQEEPEKRADYLKKIEESSNVLLSIINNVLEMARIEKGTIEIDESAWSAEQFNDTLYGFFQDMMSQKGIRFTRQLNVEHHYVYCDPIKLREVFFNILSNAYKYTNAGGSVDMRLEELPSEREGYAMYRTTITDTGIGMSEDFLPHIFEEFSRENTSTENKIEGTGLGMPIVKRLVELMEGTIEVISKKGSGSTFIVTIPHRITEKSSLVEHAGVEIDPKLFVGKRILLAEDNELNAEIAMEILGETGFIVERAEDGRVCCEKLSSAEDNYYDLILMDIQMPNINGYEATRMIRQMEDAAKANIPILAMTANAFEEDKREALRAGMNGHLAKPINVTELMKALTGILK